MLFIIYQKTVDFCQKKNQALSESEYNDGKYFLYNKIDIKQFKNEKNVKFIMICNFLIILIITYSENQHKLDWILHKRNRDPELWNISGEIREVTEFTSGEGPGIFTGEAKNFFTLGQGGG